MNNQIRQGESISNWRRRLRNRSEDGVYAGELKPAIVTAGPTISQDKKTIGSKSNDYRVNQSSLFGQRKYNPNPSIAARFLNGITDKLHLTSPPTFKDGYNRTLNAEVPLSESAQGQELKRMGSTALKGTAIAGLGTLPFSLYYAPLATGAGAVAGAAATKAVNEGMDLIENTTNSKFTPTQRTVATFFSSLPIGTKGYKWGWNTEKRAIETAMNASDGMPNSIDTIKFNIKNRTNKQQQKDILKYIFTGKGKKPKEIIPDAYQGSSESWGQWTANPKNPSEGDMVRAFLYDEPIPELQEVTGSGKYGVHDDYILQNYPHKYNKIRVYEGEKAGTIPVSEVVDPWSSESTTGDITFKNPYFTVDAGGHRLETGVGSSAQPYYRNQDIWKFNANDYNARWGEHYSSKLEKSALGKAFRTWGLNFVDAHGTPVITRTKWYLQN